MLLKCPSLLPVCYEYTQILSAIVDKNHDRIDVSMHDINVLITDVHVSITDVDVSVMDGCFDLFY